MSLGNLGSSVLSCFPEQRSLSEPGFRFLDMKYSKILHYSRFLATAAILPALLPLSLLAAKFPPLNSPAAAGVIPGKMVWADLFTTDPESAQKFYCGLLGWTAESIEQKGKGYTIFSNAGEPVAGLSPRGIKGKGHPSRWIGYYSVGDISASLALVSKSGGSIKADSRKFPNRGFQAIFVDAEGVPLGLIQSSSGDAPDRETPLGSWNWYELYAKNPNATADFFHEVLGLDSSKDTKPESKNELVLQTAGKSRGGISQLPDLPDAKASWLGVIRVSNLDSTLAKVAGLGGEVILEPRGAEFGSRFAIVLDPTGGTIGLVEYVDSASSANTP